VDKLTYQQIIEYFSRSFKTADGLWFMKIEEKYGFDAALEADKEVWKVMPKIQARMIKTMLKLGDSETDLLESLRTKLSLEGFKFNIQQIANGFRIIINVCPWYDLMVKKGRQKYSGKVGSAICGIEYSIWSSEFTKDTHFILGSQKCKDSQYCILEFVKC